MTLERGLGRERAHPAGGLGPSRRRRDRGRRDRVRAGVARVHVRRPRRGVDRRVIDAVGIIRLSAARSRRPRRTWRGFARSGGRGVVLRFGRFYAPESDQAEAMVGMARRGVLIDVGDGRRVLADDRRRRRCRRRCGRARRAVGHLRHRRRRTLDSRRNAGPRSRPRSGGVGSGVRRVGWRPSGRSTSPHRSACRTARSVRQRTGGRARRVCARGSASWSAPSASNPYCRCGCA